MPIHLHIVSASLTLWRKSWLSPVYTILNLTWALRRSVFLLVCFLANHGNELADSKNTSNDKQEEELSVTLMCSLKNLKVS